MDVDFAGFMFDNWFMENLITKTTGLALHLIQPYIENTAGGDQLVIDATCGNGHDTLALAEMMFSGSGGAGRLIAVDIQPQAIDATRALLESAGFGARIEDGSIQLICTSHEDMQKLLQ